MLNECKILIQVYIVPVIYLAMHNYAGSGYRSYRVLPEALHAFVDHFEVTSSKGIFKVWKSNIVYHSFEI